MLSKYRIRTFLERHLGGLPFKIYCKFNLQPTEFMVGRKIHYNPSSDIGRSIYFAGKFEEEEINLLSQYLNENSVVVDIGANIGLHSIYLSEQVKNGLVIAFEPSVETFEILLKNIKGIDNILPLNLAVYDRTKLDKFYIASDNAYSSLKDTNRKNIVNILNVLCVKLDDILMPLGLPKIDLIKIDVEGFEKYALLGMQKIIETYNPIIFCEIYKGENSNEDPEGTIDLIVSKGYDAFVFINGVITPYTEHNDNYYNYLFLPQVQLNEV